MKQKGRYVIIPTVKECKEVLEHLNDEESKGMLGGMAWDEVAWYYSYMTNGHGFTKEQMKNMYPHLFGHID